MAKTLSMSHSTDHPPSQKRVTAPHTHPAPRHGQPSPRKRPAADHAGLVSAILAVAAVGAAALWYWLAPAREDADQRSEHFLHQMQQAAQGTVPSAHIFGGPLNVVEKDGRVMVVAFALPSKACVQAGWRLSKQGLIVVNGILPPRLSAAKLAELCSQNDAGAVLTWIPEQTPGAPSGAADGTGKATGATETSR